MATITPLKHTPHTCIENSIIDNMAQIGVYGSEIAEGSCKLPIAAWK